MRPSQYRKLWIPDLQVKNLKDKEYLKDKDRRQFLNGIHAIARSEDYDLFQSYTSRTTISCVMDFKPFPFDEHVCYYEVNIYLNNYYFYLLVDHYFCAG